MVEINIIDNSEERYTIHSSTTILGRMYENNANKIKVTFPDSELMHECTMIVTRHNIAVDHIAVLNGEEIDITDTLSEYKGVDIGFSFSGDNGYIKNSEIKEFEFLPAQKPNGFVPTTPQQTGNINTVIKKGFANITLKQGTTNTYEFRNIFGEVVSEITLVGGSGGSGGIVNETDPTVPQYVKDISESDINNWNNKLDKVNSTSNNDRVYIIKADGTQGTMVVTNGLDANAIVRRGNGGQFASPEPTNDLHVANKGYVDRKVADLVDSAPETLDTLGEVAKAIEENADVVEALNSAIGNKADKSMITTLKATQLEDDSYSITFMGV